ncbi:ankyrin, partial [Aspergillus crustosus]
MSLSGLPSELILLITDVLVNQKDLNSFMRSNRRFYTVIRPVLYRHNAHHRNSSALLFAAKHGCTHLVQRLFAAGASLSASDTGEGCYYDVKPDGSITDHGNPLLAAAQQGYLATVRALLGESRPSRACTKPQIRPVLHWAIRSGNLELLNVILPTKVSLGMMDRADRHYNHRRKNSSALGVAIHAGCSNTILERLLEEGAEVDETEDPHPWYEAATQRGGQMLELMLKYGRRPKSDRILSELALGRNNTAALEIFTDTSAGGLDIRVYGHTALFTAVEQGHFDVVKWLIAKGANPHLHCTYRDAGGIYSTIWAAVEAQRSDILRYLIIEQAVRPDEQDLKEAKDLGFEEGVALLSECNYANNIPDKEDIPSYVARMEQETSTKPPRGFRVAKCSPCRLPNSQAMFIPLLDARVPLWYRGACWEDDTFSKPAA